MIKQKKGIALNQAFGAVLTLVLIGILVIIGIFIFVSLNTTFVNISSATIINESVAPDTGGVPLAGADVCASTNFVITEAINGTAPVITAANYTVDSVTGLFSNLTSEFNETAAWNVSYTYDWGSEACTAGEEMITQFATYPVLVGLVGTIIFLGLVIGVLVASFVFGRREGV